MKLIFLLLLTSLVVNGRRLNKIEEGEAAPKVSIKLYFEALCPGCSIFIHQQLKSFWADPDLRAIADVAVFPAGNGKCVKSGSNDFKCQCQHGPDECLSNQLMDCVINKYPDPVKYLPFVFCQDFHTLKDTGAKCLRASRMDSSLLQCAKSAKGRALQAATYAKTPSNHQYVPWVTLNGKHSSAAEANLVSAVCKAYTGTKPSACNKVEIMLAKPANEFCFKTQNPFA